MGSAGWVMMYNSCVYTFTLHRLTGNIHHEEKSLWVIILHGIYRRYITKSSMRMQIRSRNWPYTTYQLHSKLFSVHLTEQRTEQRYDPSPVFAFLTHATHSISTAWTTKRLTRERNNWFPVHTLCSRWRICLFYYQNVKITFKCTNIDTNQRVNITLNTVKAHQRLYIVIRQSQPDLDYNRQQFQESVCCVSLWHWVRLFVLYVENAVKIMHIQTFSRE